MRNKSNLLLAAVLCLLIACNAFASSPPWTGSGTYTFDDIDPYFSEGSIFDTATVDISGGSFGKIQSYDYSTINMFDGEGDRIVVENSSNLNMWGGTLDFISFAFEEAELEVVFHIDSYIFNPDSFIGYDNLTGTWFNDNGTFDILIDEGSLAYFNFVPEPTTLFLLAMGSLFLRK